MKHVLSLCAIFLIASLQISYAQRKIEAPEGYTTQVGVIVSMLDDLKGRVEYHVKGLDQQETDFLLDDQANSIGAMILHLAATERIYQRMTFEGWEYRTEDDEWAVAMGLGDRAREELQGKPISYYLGKWDEVRAKTKEVLKTKDDAWLAEMMYDDSMNFHWAWYHVMEHQANHMGQIVLIKKRLEN